MVKAGTRIDESGTLVQEGEQLLFRRELGGRWTIEDWPKSEVALGQLGRLVGVLIDDRTVAFERFTIET